MIMIDVHDDGMAPAYATAGAAALDCYARTAVRIGPRPTLVPLGFRMALPDGWQAEIRPRSGLALKHGVTVTNAPGTIDSDYRGEVGAIMHTLPRWEPLEDMPERYDLEPVYFDVNPGDRVCQMVITRCERLPWRFVDQLPESRRGEGGFGSTGT